jgi:hypothetical protein
MLTSDWFEMKLLATFERDTKRPWMTSSASLPDGSPINLTKEEKEDPRYLARRISEVLAQPLIIL